MALLKETQDRIKADAKAAFPFGGLIRTTSSRVGYIAGATAEHERAQVLIDVLEWIKTFGPNLSIKFIDKALQQFKDGKGRESVVGKCVKCGRHYTHANESGICNKCEKEGGGE